MTLSPRAQELFQQSRRTPPRLVNSAASSLHLYGVVGQDFTAASVVEALNELESARGPVTVYVNSPGGDYFAGKAIHSALMRFARSHKLTAVVDGIAASAAALLLMAAPRVEMSPGSTLMVHEVHASGAGRAQDLEALAAMVRAENDQLVGIYQRRTGLDAEKLRAMLDAETFMTDAQAVEHRFADGIVGETPKPAPRNDAAITKRVTNLRISALRGQSAKGTRASPDK